MSDLGPLAAALAKARKDFKPVTRSKTVTVPTKTGGEYTFSYAPLEVVLAAVQDSLSANGLAIVQLLDEGYLVTSLLHESGAILSGRAELPGNTDIQGLGSAVTYLRRYAIQALLGIAAEEDDDGNRAVGNAAEERTPLTSRAPSADEPAEMRPEQGKEAEAFLGILAKSGVVRKGGSSRYQLDVRESPAGPTFGFRLELAEPDESGGHKNIPQVLVPPAVAVPLLADIGGDPAVLEKQSVRVKGHLFQVASPGRQSYYRLVVREWKDGERTIPPEEAPSVPMFEEPVLPEPPDDVPLVGEKKKATKGAE